MTLSRDRILDLAKATNSFDAVSVERYQKEQDAPVVMHGVRRKGPWTHDAQLGQAIPIDVETLNPVTGSIDLLLNQGPVKFKMDEMDLPQIWTLALGISGPDFATEAAGRLIYEFVAKVQFGCGASYQSVEFNIQNGAVISGPANSITVEIQRDGAFSSENLVPNATQIYYTVARRNTSLPPVQRIIRASADTGALSNLVRIPPFARYVYLMADSRSDMTLLTTAGNALVFTDGSGGNEYGAVPAQQLFSYVKFPIPDHARFIVYDNAAGGAPVTFKYFFDICF